MNITVTKAVIPPCCGNCQFNEWLEDGPHCAHPAHWDESQFEIDQSDGRLRYCGNDMTEGGEIEFDDVCEHHRPGLSQALTDPNSTLLRDLKKQRYAEMKAKLAAPEAGEAAEA